MYKTVFTLTVLSEESIPDLLDLNHVMYECDNGDYILHSCPRIETAVSDEEMSELLYEAGSEPEFFGLEKKLLCVHCNWPLEDCRGCSE